jgi:hypothetical protein
MGMRSQLLRAAAVAAFVGAVVVAGVAGAEKPTVVRAGNLILKVNGSVAPKKLPKRRLAPVTLRISGSIRSVDGSQPPAAKTVTIDFDKHGTVNAKGLAICRPGQLQSRDTTAAKAACSRAIVGKGSTTVRVAFPEQAPFTSTGPLALFNGGVRGGVTKMFIHAYVNVPAPTAIVATVRIKRIREGRFGTRAVTTIPKVAGGSGVLTRFNLAIRRNFVRDGKRQSYLLARCANGRFFAHGLVRFKDGTRVAADVVRRCQARG